MVLIIFRGCTVLKFSLVYLKIGISPTILRTKVVVLKVCTKYFFSVTGTYFLLPALLILIIGKLLYARGNIIFEIFTSMCRSSFTYPIKKSITYETFRQFVFLICVLIITTDILNAQQIITFTYIHYKKNYFYQLNWTLFALKSSVTFWFLTCHLNK